MMAKYGGYVTIDDNNEIDTSKSLGQLFAEEFDRMIAKDIADVIKKHFPNETIDEGKVLKLAQMVLADDVAPVKHGAWEEKDHSGISVNGYMACSVCNAMIPRCEDNYYCLHRLNYCPNCGAQMKGGVEE